MPPHAACIPICGFERTSNGNLFLVIEIDGSAGEGGGQIVRTAVSLAAITGRAVEIVRLRERRERPGLQPQHLAAVRAAAAVCGAELVGAEIGARRLRFEPRHPPKADEYLFDVRTAGATTLVLQTVLVPLLHARGPSSVEVVGGTHQPMAPTADYVRRVYVPGLRRFGASVDVEYGPAGYYPRGGGRLRALLSGGDLHGVEMVRRGARAALDAIIVTSRLPGHVGERGASTIAQRLPDVSITVCRPYAFSAGAAVTIVAMHDGGLGGSSSIGRPGLPMESVADEACDAFDVWDRSDAACDRHLADQLVLPATVARGPSRWTTPVVTDHLTTVLDVAAAFVPIHASITDGCVEIVPP
jgi:RNA 3'-terminal phosphate cyclase (ATP)